MSGYLQRLARNVITPPRSIHPAVGSIFSPPKEERTPVPLLEYEEIETIASPSESRAPVPSAMPPRAVRKPASPEGKPRQGTQIPEQPEAFQPIAPIPQRAAPTVSTPRNSAQPLEEPGPLQNSDARPQPTIHAEADEAYTPLLPPAAQSADAGVEIFRPSQTAASQKETFAAPRRAAASEREPDEIQIHIGRIEVTAVPQTAPRPAVVPPNKSVNLDEYLKRGRGRA